jgi:hypothetical protein
VSHYVIPAKGVLLFPIGAVRTRNAAKPPKRARSGARRHDRRRHMSKVVGTEVVRAAA